MKSHTDSEKNTLSYQLNEKEWTRLYVILMSNKQKLSKTVITKIEWQEIFEPILKKNMPMLASMLKIFMQNLPAMDDGSVRVQFSNLAYSIGQLIKSVSNDFNKYLQKTYSPSQIVLLIEHYLTHYTNIQIQDYFLKAILTFQKRENQKRADLVYSTSQKHYLFKSKEQFSGMKRKREEDTSTNAALSNNQARNLKSCIK